MTTRSRKSGQAAARLNYVETRPERDLELVEVPGEGGESQGEPGQTAATRHPEGTPHIIPSAACPEHRTELVEACPELCRRVHRRRAEAPGAEHRNTRPPPTPVHREYDSPTSPTPLSRKSGIAAPPLLLLHGLGSRWQTWLHLIPLLTLRWHVYAPDLPGHGLSPHTPGRYRAIDHAGAALDFFRDAVAPPGRPAAVIGHSLGGAAAAILAASAPESVSALVLADPPIFNPAVGYRGAEFRDFFIAVREIARARLPFDQLLVTLAENFPHRDAAGHRLYAANLHTIDPEVYTPSIERRLFEDVDWDLTLSRIRCPVLLIQADPAMESALSDDAATHAASMLRDATLVRMHGIGHALHRDAPTEFSRILTDFLESL